MSRRHIRLGLLCSALCYSAISHATSVHNETKLKLSGELRARYENLDGQFRKNHSGSDQLLLLRSLLHGKYIANHYTIGLELQDSRTYLGDEGTPLSSSFSNTTDILQAYVQLNKVPSVFGESGNNQVTIGRQTVNIGSKRQIQRINFANVIKSFTGIHSVSSNTNQDELHFLYLVPIERKPGDRQDVEDNKFKFDKEQWHRRLWGLHYRKNKAFESVLPNAWAELYAYGFDEKDTKDAATVNRHTLTTGARLFKKHQPQEWNYDFETAFQTGTRHESKQSDDDHELDVSARLTVFRLGYTFKHPLNPNLAFQYYYASGDDTTSDNKYGRYEMLFGGRRTDLNNTSIHGPLTPANISATGFRIELRPDSNWDARIHYSSSRLSSDTGNFVVGKYRDETGQSGDFLGHSIDSRYRYWTADKNWTFETGLSLLFPGEYIKNVRAEEEQTKRTTFVYGQVEFKF